MKKKNVLLAVAAGVAMVLSSGTVLAQKDSSSVNVLLGADVVSSYIWRGAPSVTPDGSASSSLSPNIQPSLSVGYKNFTVGLWASYDFLGKYYETDLSASYTFSRFTVTLSDYFWSYNARYFDYKNESTAHIIEAMLTYSGGDGFPFYLSAGTMLYGADKKAAYDPTELDLKKQNYSTYIEAGYRFNLGHTAVTSFVGATPTDGYYGDGAGAAERTNVKGFQVVNVGLSAAKAIPLTDKFSLPLKASFIVNPVLEKAYLVVALTL